MLELARVAKIYGVKVVFKNVSCAFAAGSVSLLVGGNGAGKSTLMRVMAGLAQPSAGAVRQDDDLRVGYLGHSTFLYAGLSALENLNFWREAYGLRLSRQDLLACLERVGLGGPRSGAGRDFFTRHGPAPEPGPCAYAGAGSAAAGRTGHGLDAASLALLRREISTARARGACVVLISHDLAGDAPLADRLLALGEGRLLFDGPPAGFDGFAASNSLAPDALTPGAFTAGPCASGAPTADRPAGGPPCCA